MKLTILVTCVGGVYAPDTIEALRSDEDLDVRIVGADANPEAAGRIFTDAFYPVPAASEDPEGFVVTLQGVCDRESVALVLPGADEEVLALSRCKADFERVGVRCAVEETEKVEIMRDKLRVFCLLEAKGIQMPEFAEVRKVEDIESFARNVGYPRCRFILKPRSSRGARNLVLVDSGEAELTHPSAARGPTIGPLHLVIEWLEDSSFAGLMAMEYLSGAAYDVDCLAREGNPLCVVVRKRLWQDPFSPSSQGCIVERNERVEAAAVEIIRALSLSYALDLDMGTDVHGEPGLFELNPRWSGAVAAARGGGVNIPALLIRSMLDLPISEQHIRPGTRMQPVTRMAFFRV